MNQLQLSAGKRDLTAGCNYAHRALEGVSTFVRRSIFQRYGHFRVAYRLAKDYEFWLHSRNQCGGTQTDQPLAAFRVHAGSASQAHSMASFNEDFRARFQHGPWWMWPEFAARYAVRRWRGEAGGG